jgi:hypothetical protein
MTAETVLALLHRYGARAEEVGGRVKIIGASRLPPEVLEGARSVRHNLAKLLAASKTGDTAGALIDGASNPLAPPSNYTAINRRQVSPSHRQDYVVRSAARCGELQRRLDSRRHKTFTERPSTCVPVNERLGVNFSSIRRKPHKVKLKQIPRPDEPPRLDWWRQPVYGWSEGKLRLTSTITGETFEIDLRA